MKRTYLYSAVILGLLASACSHSGGSSLTAPTATAAPTTSSSTRVITPKTVASPGLDFSDQYLGQVTVTNNDTQTHTFAYYVWDATNEENQQLKDRQQAVILPGQSFTFQLAFQQDCGAKYQRDVYRDIQNYPGATTESEVRNYFFGAAGVYWQSEVGKCDTPTIPPPVIVPPPAPTCQDREANNFGGLLPCTYGEGVIIVEEPPVDVVTPPQNFLFCHVAVNVTGGKNPKTIVHETQVGGLNGIPLTAITNAHSIGVPHGVTTEHLYDYYGVCDGRGIGPQ